MHSFSMRYINSISSHAVQTFHNELPNILRSCIFFSNIVTWNVEKCMPFSVQFNDVCKFLMIIPKRDVIKFVCRIISRKLNDDLTKEDRTIKKIRIMLKDR